MLAATEAVLTGISGMLFVIFVFCVLGLSSPRDVRSCRGHRDLGYDLGRFGLFVFRFLLLGLIKNKCGGGRVTVGEQTNDGGRASERATAGGRRRWPKAARATVAATGERRRADERASERPGDGGRSTAAAHIRPDDGGGTQSTARSAARSTEHAGGGGRE